MSRYELHYSTDRGQRVICFTGRQSKLVLRALKADWQAGELTDAARQCGAPRFSVVPRWPFRLVLTLEHPS